MTTQQMFKKLTQVAKSKHIPIIDGHALVDNGRIYATNLDTFLSYDVNLKGRAVVPVKDLSKMKFDTLEIQGENLIVTNKGLVSKIKLSFSPDDFPILGECTKRAGKLTERTLQHLKTAAKFVSKDDTRPVLNGVYIDKGHVAATDAHRLFYAKKPKNEASDIIIPKEIVSLISEDTYQVFISSDGLQTCFKGELETIYFKPIEGKYPNYHAVIPKNYEAIASVDRLQLKQAIEVAIGSANSQIPRAVFTFYNNALELYAFDIEKETEFKQEIPVSWTMADFMKFQIGFNLKFILEILSAIKEPTVSLQLLANNKACLINDNFLIMPLVLENYVNVISSDGWLDLRKQYKPVAEVEPEPSNEEQPEPVAEVEPEVSSEGQPEPPFIYDYTEKAIAVFGDTKPFRKQLKEIKGRWNPNLKLNGEKTPGWIFSKKRNNDVKQILGL